MGSARAIAAATLLRGAKALEGVLDRGGKAAEAVARLAELDAKAVEAMALADPQVARHLEGQTVRKVVVVPGRLVNIVASGT